MKRSHRFQFSQDGDLVTVTGYRRVARGRISRTGSVTCKREELREVLADPKTKNHIGLLDATSAE